MPSIHIGIRFSMLLGGVYHVRLEKGKLAVVLMLVLQFMVVNDMFTFHQKCFLLLRFLFLSLSLSLSIYAIIFCPRKVLLNSYLALKVYFSQFGL
ncbi:unnamed protein product [Camellia sinensis]